MKLSTFIILACVVLLAGLSLFNSAAASTQKWEMKSCGSLDCVTDFLNTLPPANADTAKVTTINSQRSFMGALSDPYKIWYRK